MTGSQDQRKDRTTTEVTIMAIITVQKEEEAGGERAAREKEAAPRTHGALPAVAYACMRLW